MARARCNRRYLLARVAGREDEHVLLQFPPGLLIRDVLRDPHDPREIERAGFEPSAWWLGWPIVSKRFLDLLRDADVRVVKRGSIHHVYEALAAAHETVNGLTLAACVRGCLDANSRLARCDAPAPVSLGDYAMNAFDEDDDDLWLGLRDAAMREGAAIIGRVAARREDLDRFRWLTIADALEAGNAALWDRGYRIPCRFHGRTCQLDSPRDMHFDVGDGLLPWWLWARVPLLPDDADRAEHDSVAWARDIARRVLDTLPDEAWSPRKEDFGPHFAQALAYARAETCEEYALLAAALGSCRSPREAVRRARARDAAWEVGRALDGPAAP